MLEANYIRFLCRAVASPRIFLRLWNQAILRLRMLDDPRRLLREEHLEEEAAHADAPMSFFWTFLGQVTALIERARLQRENLRIEILQRTDVLRAVIALYAES